MLQASALSQYDGLWARVVIVTLYSVVLYKTIGAIEKMVLHRFGAIAPTR